MGIGDFEEWDLGNNRLNEPRTGMSVGKNFYEEIYLLSHEKHQAYRFSSIQEPVGLFSDIFQLLCRNENYIRCKVCHSILGKRG